MGTKNMISLFSSLNVHLRRNPDRGPGHYLTGVSARTRGSEIAEAVKGKFNPVEGYENDVCIYIKPSFRRLVLMKKGDYLDVLDGGHEYFRWLRNNPEIKIIAMTLFQYDMLKADKRFRNEIVLIPHPHINQERILRDRKEIKVCGFVGAYREEYKKTNEIIKSKLAELGMEFLPLHDFQTRQDAINYYKQIDIQLLAYDTIEKPPNHAEHPTKIINAASFGIPTIALKRPAYKEVEGYYIQLRNLDSLVEQVRETIKDYDQWSKKVIDKAEEYYIDNIAGLYHELDGWIYCPLA